LLGTDLVKDPVRLEAAYNDSRGITADFNRNVLRVLNNMLGANFDLAAFEHRAFFDPNARWIEMRLVANRAQHVQIPRLELEMRFQRGDEIRTEISAKYDRSAVEQMLTASGFRLAEWHSDPADLFAVSLAQHA